MLWSIAFRGVALVQAIALTSLLPQLSAFGGTRGLQPVAVKLANYCASSQQVEVKLHGAATGDVKK